MKDIIPQDYDGISRAEPPSRKQENPALMLHRHLRGRYKWALLVGLLLAIPLGIGGYFAVAPTYTSTGIVRVAPTLQMTIYNDLPEAKVPPLFESMVATQASLLTSRRVLDLALADKELQAAGWPDGADGIALLQKNLDVSNRRAIELITATVKHSNPALAQKAVNAILKAYEQVYDEGSLTNASQKERALRDRQNTIRTEIESYKQTINEFAKKYATDDISGIHEQRIMEIAKLDQDIQTLDRELATRSNGNDPAAPQAPVAPSPAQEKESVEALALEDATLARYLDDKRNLLTAIDAMLKNLGPEHRQVREAKRRLEAVETQIANRAEEVRKLPRASRLNPTSVVGMSLDELKEKLANYKDLHRQKLADANEMQTTKLAIAHYRELIETRKQDLEEVSRTLEQISFESRTLAIGRVSVLQKGDYPVRPYTDRRIPLAVIGALAGLGLGGCIVLGVAMIRGGYRYIDDVERTEGAAIPLLGTVPDLTDGGVEQEQMAALSVHHLRNMLQLQFDRGPGGKVFTITSSTAGDGKTSLAIALAMSFAATGRRTIIVDTDLVGRGLTRQLDLVGQPGLCEAIQQDKLNGEVKETKVPSLWAIPSGSVKGFVPEHLSGGMMSGLIAKLRDQYDAIILDTGPILGSLEANVAAPAADGVVLVVSRGQNAKMVRASIQRLRRLGATPAGLIFNRAGARDFQTSVSTASVSARSIQQQTAVGGSSTTSGRTALLRALEPPTPEKNPTDS